MKYVEIVDSWTDLVDGRKFSCVVHFLNLNNNDISKHFYYHTLIGEHQNAKFMFDMCIEHPDGFFYDEENNKVHGASSNEGRILKMKFMGGSNK